MDEHTRIALGGMADEVLDVAERLILVGERLNNLTGTESGAIKETWMAGAQRELSALIRQVEGPRAD